MDACHVGGAEGTSPPCRSWRTLLVGMLLTLLSPQTEYARLENGRFVYRIHRSPMCEYMINFIHKLKHLPEKYMMNSVLENFTILQVPPLLFLPAPTAHRCSVAVLLPRGFPNGSPGLVQL